jgi:hypothetical protein
MARSSILLIQGVWPTRADCLFSEHGSLHRNVISFVLARSLILLLRNKWLAPRDMPLPRFWLTHRLRFIHALWFTRCLCFFSSNGSLVYHACSEALAHSDILFVQYAWLTRLFLLFNWNGSLLSDVISKCVARSRSLLFHFPDSLLQSDYSWWHGSLVARCLFHGFGSLTRYADSIDAAHSALVLFRSKWFTPPGCLFPSLWLTLAVCSF